MQDKVLAVMQDLMFMVRIQEAAKRSGLETLVVKTRLDALAKADDRTRLIFIDLNHEAGEPLELIKDLKADPKTKGVHVVAFVSHVQTELRAAAVSGGCDTVLARSVFVQNLPELISSCLPK